MLPKGSYGFKNVSIEYKMQIMRQMFVLWFAVV